MISVTIDIDEDILAQLDALIARGAAESREAAIRAGLRMWLRTERDSEIVDAG
jgi:Arc/MetJ-type ribon-helix-helix transcriptional regulator